MHLPVSLSFLRCVFFPWFLKIMEYLSVVFTVGTKNWLALELLNSRCFPSVFHRSFFLIKCHLILWRIFFYNFSLYFFFFLQFFENLYYTFHPSWKLLRNYFFLIHKDGVRLVITIYFS